MLNTIDNKLTEVKSDLNYRFNSAFDYPSSLPEWKYQFHDKLTQIDSLETMLDRAYETE